MCAAASSPGPDCRLSCSTVLPAPLLEQPRRLWERREEKGRVGLCSQCSVSGKQSRAWPLVGAGGGLLAQKGQMLVIIEENIQPSPPNEPPGSFFPCDSPFSCSGDCPRGAGEARGGSHTQQCHTGGKRWERRKRDRSGAGRETEMLQDLCPAGKV